MEKLGFKPRQSGTSKFLNIMHTALSVLCILYLFNNKYLMMHFKYARHSTKSLKCIDSTWFSQQPFEICTIITVSFSRLENQGTERLSNLQKIWSH